jgi:hypothetical protein
MHPDETGRHSYPQPGAYPVSPPPQQYAPQYPPQQYGPPPKKKSKTGLVLAIVLCAMIVLCGGGVLVAAKIGKSASKPQATVAMDTPARDGKFEFVVKSASCRNAQVGTATLGKAAQGQFCLVTVSVKNIGTKAQTFDSGDQHARGADGTKYDSDPTAEIYVNKDANTLFNEINPGNTATGVLVFDIPKTAKLASVELHDSAFSGGISVTIPT